ncbi:hypothetical protein OPT61_g4415 [Boeremia exigua]|uniref:Uncharacterized protein n=1 Tax=Boeremia exigua TaxID=749465 RepID=A0ACC2IE77_9PLEO|nr:hypothetical protein OPT61_g4415 [Boeremia exigua]
MDIPYTVLNLARREIRLLELAPGEYDDELVISLNVDTLHQNLPEYYALSYAWGQYRSSQMALVDGRSVGIGLNLDCALRHIRCSLSQPLLMWVDALCINQRDVEERNAQVLLMRDIYSSAERVLISLGPEHPGDAVVIARVREKIIPQTEEEYFFLLEYVAAICQRPWFGRVWVAQELALSQKDPTVYLGANMIPWSQMYDYFISLERTPSPLNGDLRITSFMEIMYRMRRFGRVRAFQTTSLTLQIFRLAPALSTDARDKVFGLLGICAFTPNQMRVAPDYTKSISRVFAEATFSMLQEGSNLPYGLLPLQPPRNIQEKHPRQIISDLPTWAFDLNISSQAERLLGQIGPYWLIPNRAVHPGALLESTNHIPNRVQISDDFKRLVTVGSPIGSIIASFSSAINTEQYMGFQKRMTALRNIYNKYLKPRRISAHSLLQALTVDRKTPLQDQNLSDHLSHLFEHLLNSQTEMTFPSSFFDILVALSNHEDCHIFLTDNNQVGITYHPDVENGIREGDEVVGLLGINFPFVLRPVPGGASDVPKYTMINIAHVADHQWRHTFLENAGPSARWSDFENCGLKEYTIV